MLPALLALALTPPTTADFPDPWAVRGDLDVRTISTGEAVELEPHLEPGHFTVFDFGAPWCAPCHGAAAQLRPYLQEHADVAVRAVTVAGDPGAFADQPVVKQHLRGVNGVPWFVVYAPGGEVIYKGHRVKVVERRIDRRRQRLQRASEGSTP